MSEIRNKMSSSNINLDGIELMDLFQIAHYLRLTSIIKVASSSKDIGYILFENGEITHCKVEDKSVAETAFEEILSWNNYTVKNFKYDKDVNLERNITMRFEIFLLDTIRKIDEKQRAEPKEKNENRDFTSLYEIEKINEFCKKQLLENTDVMAISVLNIVEKNIVGIAYNSEENKELVHELTNNFFSVGMNKSIGNIEKLLGSSYGKAFIAEEYYISGDIFQVSKSISEHFVLSLVWGSEFNRMFALKSVRNILLELDTIL